MHGKSAFNTIIAGLFELQGRADEIAPQRHRQAPSAQACIASPVRRGPRETNVASATLRIASHTS